MLEYSCDDQIHFYYFHGFLLQKYLEQLELLELYFSKELLALLSYADVKYFFLMGRWRKWGVKAGETSEQKKLAL